MSEAEENLDRLAKILTGKDVIVRFRPPVTRGMKGETSRIGDSAVIDILPGMDTEIAFKIFLHEVAHVKLHLDTILSTQDYLRPSASIDYQAAVEIGEVTTRTDPRESEADKQADEWLKDERLKFLWCSYTNSNF